MSHLKPRLEATAQLLVFDKNTDTKGAFRHGVAELLQGVIEKGSLVKASEDMDISYSKAWRIVNQTEKTLGLKLITRSEVRGSTLTPEAKKLLRVYNHINKEISQIASARFKELMQTQI
jgi:molybdate transport system regulatory protein